ncbi:MAG: DNRLRE domain-containing protein [Bacteroidota bacterium]
MKNPFLLLLIVFSGIGVRTNAQEKPIQVFQPVHDAYVRGGQHQDKNFNLGRIEVRSARKADYQRLGVMIFDISALKKVPQQAVLKLTLGTYGKDNPESVKIGIYRCSNTKWQEKSVTAADIQLDGPPIAWSELSKTTKEGSWDITEFLAERFEQDGIVAIVIKNDTSEGSFVSFHSKEGFGKPSLEIY